MHAIKSGVQKWFRLLRPAARIFSEWIEIEFDIRSQRWQETIPFLFNVINVFIWVIIIRGNNDTHACDGKDKKLNNPLVEQAPKNFWELSYT